MSHTYRVLTPHLAGLTSLKLTAAATITTDITTETLQGMPKRKGQCARLGLLGGGGVQTLHATKVSGFCCQPKSLPTVYSEHLLPSRHRNRHEDMQFYLG